MCITPNIIFWTLWILSFCGYFLFTYLYGLFATLDWYNVVPLAMDQPQFWLAMLLIPLVLSITDYAADVFWAIVDPSSRDQLVAKLEEDYKLDVITGNNTRRSDGNGKDGVALRALSNGSSGSVVPNVRNPINSDSPVDNEDGESESAKKRHEQHGHHAHHAHHKRHSEDKHYLGSHKVPDSSEDSTPTTP